jgi:hypothetical protein
LTDAEEHTTNLLARDKTMTIMGSKENSKVIYEKNNRPINFVDLGILFINKLFE